MTIENPQELLKLGVKHQKMFESTTVNLHAYKLHNKIFYLTQFKNKFTAKLKATGLICTQEADKQEYMQAFKQLIYYSVTYNNIRDGIEERAKLNVQVFEEIKSYLRGLLDSNLLVNDDEVAIYKRQLEVMEKSLALQEEMVEIWNEINIMDKEIVERGYFTDEELEKQIGYIPISGWIQYAQMKIQYDYKEDFDLIYENSINPNFKKYENFTKPDTLKNMTSNIAGPQLKKSMDRMTDGIDMSHMTREEYISYWLKTYKDRLEERFLVEWDKIRFPRFK
ncbi:hypothetical protein [Ornithinibacillus scapharcae]|uniref:hypothetical protein n=1 Tax=Ornithinibacillus scapharcae TaxID=1147159 RepID=UPI000225B3F2|nr:hypothetical protein [Ornithinibacillus scapharcae]